MPPKVPSVVRSYLGALHVPVPVPVPMLSAPPPLGLSRCPRENRVPTRRGPCVSPDPAPGRRVAGSGSVLPAAWTRLSTDGQVGSPTDSVCTCSSYCPDSMVIQDVLGEVTPHCLRNPEVSADDTAHMGQT